MHHNIIRAKPSVTDKDKFLGNVIRETRIARGVNQAELGKALGISFQQVQKYEKGINRISASRLHEISEVLTIPVTYFYDELDSKKDVLVQKDAIPHTKEWGILSSHFFSIKNPKVRQKILSLVKSLNQISEDI